MGYLFFMVRSILILLGLDCAPHFTFRAPIIWQLKPTFHKYHQTKKNLL
jgi:hypothetical protein